MDFAVPAAVSDALCKRLAHPVFGYTFRSDEFIQAIQNWLADRFDWQVARSHLLFYPPGTVAAINCLVNLFSEVGDEVIVHTPAYPPLMNIVKQNQRVLVESPLVRIDRTYQIDFDQFEKCFTKRTKILILCSPHNPSGRVWRRDELEKIAGICRQNNVLVISDEVHADLTLPGIKHCHFNRLAEESRPPSVTLISSCKTFNLAALPQSTLICDSPALKKKIKWAINTAQLNLDNALSATASLAAYQSGHQWLDSLNAYLKRNRDYLEGFLKQHLPQIQLAKAQGTYLAWLDFRALNIEHQELARLLVEKAGVGLYDGLMFGPPGEGFFRINLACSMSLLSKAMKNIKAALNEKA